ncbi:TetR/AcrR family transcriptional regulator, partial [Sinomonas humi]
EQGVVAVSNRQISEAAGQGNNTAVGYHFGTKADLLTAIVRRHQDDIERRRESLVAAAAGSEDVRAWVDCLVRPTAEHLASLGLPTWWARLSAQLVADPMFRHLLADETLRSESLRAAIEALDRCRPELPAPVREQRDMMTRQLITYGYAEREQALAARSPGLERHTWETFTVGLIDAITGLWLAPWTPIPPSHRE